MQRVKTVAKPSKQRKMIYQAPSHIRNKLFSAPLSPSLRKSHGVRSLPVRSGDTVRIMRGDSKGFEGKVTRVDRKKYRIYVEGLTREKVDGTTIFVPIHPSKVMITKLNLDDKWRRNILERRRKKTEKKKPEIVEEKPFAEEVEEIEEVAPKKEIKGKPKRRKAKRKVTKKPAKAEVKEEKPKKTRRKRKTKKKTEEKTEKAKKTKPKTRRKTRKKAEGGT